MPELPTLLLLLGAAFFAGLVDSIAGGGGLISLPSLLAAGVPPHLALGTNKVQSAMGTTISAVSYVRAGHAHRGMAILGFASAFAGSYLGAWTVLHVPASSLESLIPILIIVVAVTTFLRRDFGTENRFSGMHGAVAAAGLAFGFGIGFYDGFFGPGTGSFLAFGYVLFFRFDFVTATGNAKVANLASNGAAIVAFLIGDSILWPLALGMGLSNIVGALVGTRLAIRKGAQVIKPVFGAVLVGLLIKLLAS